MKKVVIYSCLLVAGLVLSQVLPRALGDHFPSVEHGIRFATMLCLAFIMIHVGFEFELDKSNVKQYGWDYTVAATAAAFPWIFCAMYFVFVMAPPELWKSGQLWKEALLESRFASPTSAGVLFSMLAAAGLAGTWMFNKARVLAIFDDLDTVLLMIPLKMMMVGVKWQLAVIVLLMGAMLWLAWKFLHVWRIPHTWPWVTGYSFIIVTACEVVYVLSKLIEEDVPIHIEVLLPAFVLGCMMWRSQGEAHGGDRVEGHEEGPHSPSEQRASSVISALFMVLVGLSMPMIGTNEVGIADSLQAATENAAKYGGVPVEAIMRKDAFPGWGVIALHVLVVTVISNIGKMFPVLCYRKEATLRERLAVSVGMFPRGEVGAGVLVISLSYGIGGPALTVAMLSLALNLVCTGVFIAVVKRLLRDENGGRGAAPRAA